MVEKQCSGFLDTHPVWVKEQFGIVQFKFPEVDPKTFSPYPIPTHLRLGHQMEYIFAQLVTTSKNYSIVLQNLPVRKQGRTVGEIDFILQKSGSSTLLHVELTYKFYIINPQISEPIYQLMGPNKRDMFYTKLEKIKQQQFQILHTNEGIAAPQHYKVNISEIEHQACFKAQLFIPYQSHSIDIHPLNKQCISGFWVHIDDFSLPEFQGGSYYIPKKSEWVIAPHNAVKWATHYETLLDVNLRIIQQNSPMVWKKNGNNEFEKFFVVWF